MFCLRFLWPGIPSYSAQHFRRYSSVVCAQQSTVYHCMCEWIIKSHNDTKRRIIAAKILLCFNINKEAGQQRGAAEWSQSD